MNKILKIIVYSGLVIIILYLIYFIGGLFIYGYSTDWDLYKKYTFLLKDSVSNNLDWSGNSSEVGYNDVCNSFRTKDSIRITIWDFRDLRQVDLKKIKFTQDVDLGDIKFGRGDILFSKSDIPVTVEYGFSFDNALVINLDQYSTVLSHIEKDYYRGFYGRINKLSLSNGITNKHQILFNYKNGQTPVLFLLYKDHQSFYLILIDSKKPFDEKIINILNLE
jgi:hypothetical protein